MQQLINGFFILLALLSLFQLGRLIVMSIHSMLRLQGWKKTWKRYDKNLPQPRFYSHRTSRTMLRPLSTIEKESSQPKLNLRTLNGKVISLFCGVLVGISAAVAQADDLRHPNGQLWKEHWCAARETVCLAESHTPSLGFPPFCRYPFIDECFEYVANPFPDPPPEIDCKNNLGWSGGALWKPDSESNGNAVVLLPAYYCNGTETLVSSFKVLDKYGRPATTTSLRHCGQHNGGRAHYNVNARASNLPKPVFVVYDFMGETECRKVPNPEQRYE